MKAKPFILGLSWLLLLNIIIKPLWIFLIDREVQNTVGHQSYGSYFAFFNLSYVLLFLADAGLTNMMVQQVASNGATGSHQFLKTKTFLLLLYVISCFFIGWLTGILHQSTFIYLVFIQLFGSLFLFLRGLLVANQLYKADAWFSVADKAFMIFSCSLFLYGWWQPITLTIFLQLQLASIIIVSLLLYFFIKQKGILEASATENISHVAKKIVPFAAIILLMGIHYRLDGFLLERLRPDGAWQAGIYAAAYRILDAANMLGYIAASFLVPFIARHNTDLNVTGKVVISLQHVYISMAIIGSCVVTVFAPWLQQLLYHTNINFQSQVLQLCLAVLPAYYLIHIHGSVLTATNQRKAFVLILSVAVLINIVLNLFLIPGQGAKGTCFAALVSQYSCAIACYYLSTKQLQLSPQKKYWLYYGIGTALFLCLLLSLNALIASAWIILALVFVFAIILILVNVGFIKKFIQSLTY